MKMRQALSGTRVWRFVLAFLLLYTAVHFAVSGVRLPITNARTAPRMEADPLVEYMQRGGAVTSTNPRQYGPAFFFVMHPLFKLCKSCMGTSNPYALSYALFGIEMAAVAAAFFFCVAVIRRWMDEAPNGQDGTGRPSTGTIVLILILLWFNFSPLFYMLVIKGVETWELALLAAALYTYVKGWRFAASLCIAAAALMKMLPLFFLLYFLVRDRRTFVYCCLSLLIILSAGQLLYGWQMGYGYLPFMVRAALGKTFALTWHENVSLKGQIVKAFGHWQLFEPDGHRQGFLLVIDDERLAMATLIGQLAQFAGMAWMVWVLIRPQRRASASTGEILWGWSLTSTLMVVLSPATPFEYATLLLIAFSFVVVAVLTKVDFHADRATWLCTGGAVLFVANVIPRRVLNRLLPLDTLNHWSGNGALPLFPSEAYQHYGFPLLGMLLLLAALWRLRRYVDSPNSWPTTDSSPAFS